ncbi:hypothetical protein D3C79_1039750 [compost metagenome]
MDIIGIEFVDFLALLQFGGLNRKAGCGHSVIGGHRKSNIIDPEIAVEFGGAVVLMQIPAFLLHTPGACRLIDTNFGEPLSSHYKVT